MVASPAFCNFGQKVYRYNRVWCSVGDTTWGGRMAVFLLTSQDRAHIREAVERARKNPIPWTEERAAGAVPLDKLKAIDTLMLTDRKPGWNPSPGPESVEFINGFRAAVSFEHQPAGLFMHISFSGPLPGRVPVPMAVNMVLDAFEIATASAVWMEEFAPNHHAVNILALVEAATP